MIATSELVDPAVRAFVEALNANDESALREAMTAGATMSDDGTPRAMDPWLRSEVFEGHGRMAVTRQSPDGRDLDVDYSHDKWGTMATRWHFEILDGRVAHFDTGQAGGPAN